MDNRPLIAALISTLGPACSLTLDTDEFRAAPAALVDGGLEDAGFVDGGPPDAGFVALRVDSHAPETLLEGIGAHSDVRGTAVVVFGAGLWVDHVRSDDLDVRSWLPSDDGTVLGVSLGVPVDTSLGEGDEATVTLELVRGDETELVRLNVQGLDERVVRDGDEAPTEPFPVAYSELRFEAAQFIGLSEVRWYATSGIQIDGLLRVDGLSDGTPGPGGCRGGGPEQAGDCDRAGGPGTAGDPSSGGGGGGNRTAGAPGGTTGLAPGEGGGVASSEPIVDGLRSHAGTGGGGGGGANGGQAGGGGGAIALVSRGHLDVGNIDAHGGPGAPLSGDCTQAGGGGGSGGVVLLRGWRVSGAGTVDVSGGASGGVLDCDNRGGAGGSGVLYVQGATVSAGLLASPAEAVRFAPAWAAETPVIVRSTDRLAVVGAGNFYLQVEDGAGRSLSLPPAGRLEVDLEFGEPGVRQVCLRRSEVTYDGLEGGDCLAFAVVP